MSGDSMETELARLARLARSDGRLGAKERVRRALDGERRRKSTPAGWLRLAATAALVCIAAVASAMFGHSWWKARQAQPALEKKTAPAKVGVVTPAPAPRPEPPPMIIEPQVIEQPKSTAPERRRAAPAPTLMVQHGPAQLGVSRPAFAPSVAVAPAPPPPRDPGAFQISLAMKVLRRDHDAPGALALLREYLSTHPNGEMAEEAMALAIDAAAQIDDNEAVAFAQRYLARYPRGRFAAAARDALSR